MIDAKLNIFRSSDNPIGHQKNVAGAKAVLSDYGINNLNQYFNLGNRDDLYFLTMEDVRSGQPLAGINICPVTNTRQLPLEQIIAEYKNNVHFNRSVLLGNNAELCGAWNSRNVAGHGISFEMIKIAIACSIKLKFDRLFILSTNVNNEQLREIGFTVEASLTTTNHFIVAKGFDVKLYSIELKSFVAPKSKVQDEIYNIAHKEQLVITQNTTKGTVLNLDVSGIKGMSDSTKSFIANLSVINVDVYSALINNPELLKTLNWRIFEKLIADILETLGYKIELMQGTRDGGIDVIAFMKNNEFGVHKYLLQAKRWSNKVDIDVVKNVLFNQDHYKATKSCLATTAEFTHGAWQLAEMYKWQLELKDFKAIQNWIKSAHTIKTK